MCGKYLSQLSISSVNDDDDSDSEFHLQKAKKRKIDCNSLRETWKLFDIEDRGVSSFRFWYSLRFRRRVKKNILSVECQLSRLDQIDSHSSADNYNELESYDL